jgi:ribokinase
MEARTDRNWLPALSHDTNDALLATALQMPRITNFGSCCIDNVYQVEHFVAPGETLPCTDYQVHPGGKGMNQSLALANAGADVRHAGHVGQDGLWMKDLMTAAGVDTSLTHVVEGPSGHANLQVTPQGENAIVIFAGANRLVTAEGIEEVFKDTRPGDFLLLQNEINLIPEIMHSARERAQRIVFNAAPMTSDVADYPLETVEFFIVNEIEGAAITGEQQVDNILEAMQHRFPQATTLLTLGGQGAIYQSTTERIVQPAFSVECIDSTGAGDTFTGFFLANFAAGLPVKTCLQKACRAGALCVTRQGAASSIPTAEEVG